MRSDRSAGRFQATPSGGTFKLTCQMQNRVRSFRVLLQGLDGFVRRQYLELDFPAMSLAVHLFHYRQLPGSGPDHKSSALPGNLLLYRERCMPKPVTEPSGWLFLALADAASVPSRGPEQLTSSVKIIFERIDSAPSIRAMAAKRSSKTIRPTRPRPSCRRCSQPCRLFPTVKPSASSSLRSIFEVSTTY